jgi:predicted acylesterase/phospholipase RssA
MPFRLAIAEEKTMPQIGLALSGGGFRGTFYHLGVIRFLRDAGILPNVTHITSVSGGSILAAHLTLNWERYNGSSEAFDKAAQEVIDFARLDVRNRIIRRLPLLVFGQVIRWITRKPFDRRLTRTGLLERYYQKYLYGDTCLYELPARPELHILATNLSEGCRARSRARA